MRDVFYFNEKPNVHPREKPAKDLADARRQSNTEHFWIINELCDYSGFDWDFDFEFLPDEDVWAEEHNNIWPSQHQKDSGTWLCPTEKSDIFIYRADVQPITRKNHENDNWILTDTIDKFAFDFSWHPDPTDPPFIYVWGNAWFPAELGSAIEYHVPGATERKYMSGVVKLLPEDRWVEVQPIDKNKFDLSWRPDPREPPFIYVWGNKWVPAELYPTLEYYCPGATERKYMDWLLVVLPKMDRWVIVQPIDKNKFDFTWRPDPTSPPYIYVWGNKWISAELQPTLEYHVPGATERKYMEELVDVLPEMTKWCEIQPIDRMRFDLSWRPDPREPPLIYVWGNKWVPAELQPTLEYACHGATERKYMEELVEVLPEESRWRVSQDIDQTKFDLSWRPDPREPPYIYVWGNKWVPAELQPTLEYVCPDATERKYMPGAVVVLSNEICWNEVQPIDKNKFDFTWRPDPTSPPYIYVWGNKWISAELLPTLEYHVPGATERKYMEELVEVLPNRNWVEVQPIDKNKFDLSWRPDPREPPYIYVWGNKWIPAELRPTLEYVCPGATERKYMPGEVVMLPEEDRWVEVQSIGKSFDLSWRPDPREPPFIYVWGNKWIPAELQPTLEYHVPGAVERKYMDELVDVLPEESRWTEVQLITGQFDLSWRPDPREPPYIYAWGNKWISSELKATLEYTCPGATERKYMSELVGVQPETDKWIELQAVDAEMFDMSWRPDPREPPFIYVWGNKWISAELQPTLEYHVPGATERKYMDELVEVLPDGNWNEVQPIDKSTFDLSWRPDPREPPFIYVWGNKWISPEVQSTLEYTVPGAIERNYMCELVEVLPDGNWNEVQTIDKSFDLSWRPDPREPAFIYVWGNKWIPGELRATLEYICPGATERKYMSDLVAVKPEADKWIELQAVDTEMFDMSWRPDPREPPFIYVWGNKWIPAELQPTLEYHVPGATERKYMDELVEVLPNNNWTVLIPPANFDFSWRPDPREPPFIYVWGNKWVHAEFQSTIEYVCQGATQKKYMSEVVEILPDMAPWKIIETVKGFDFSWMPDPTSPPYIYVFGNTQYPGVVMPTLEYHVEGAVDRKYITDIVPTLAPDQSLFNQLISVAAFDFSWRPDPTSPPYIYVWGNQWNAVDVEPTLEFRVPGATEYKYMTDQVAYTSPVKENFEIVEDIDSFDFSWRPDPREPAFIYVWGNTQYPGTKMPTVRYHCPGATQEKHMTDIVATLAQRPDLFENVVEKFDYSWRPDPTSPAYVYQFGTLLDEFDGPRFIVPGNDTTVVKVNRREIILENIVFPKYKIETTLDSLILAHPGEIFWALNPDLDYTEFDFKWLPDEKNVYHINAFGSKDSINSQTYFVNGKMWARGYRDINYVEGKTVNLKTIIHMFYVDRGNAESTERFEALQKRYGNIQKTRYLNSWVDTINRCINRSSTTLCWILNSELDYSTFEFDFYPSPWQMKMVHVFGTQWSHWGTTFMVNKENFAEETKYIKIIEHLSMLNFVRRKTATATNRLYDIVLIDHGNSYEFDRIPGIVVQYDHNYLNTFRRVLKELPVRKDHYVWICSSVCDYSSFDFSYICDPFAREQLHVFPSNKQKFGDTFLVDVNRLRTLLPEMTTLEDYYKINFNQHQRVNRLPPPVITVNADTHVDEITDDFSFPYAVFETEPLSIIDNEPMNLWTPETKTLIVTSTGGTRVIVPKEAKAYLRKELYDYPYIKKASTLVKSAPMDIVFLSNGETGADENYEHLLKVTNGLPNRVVRVDGVNGRVAAYHASAKASETPWTFTVFAKLKVNPKFDWAWQPDRLQIPKHYIFHATNPVNGLEYGNMATIAYNKKLVLLNKGSGLDFTLDDEHEVVEVNSGIANFNTDPWSAWRTAFRECIKLRASTDEISQQRLNIWLTVGVGKYADWCLSGAADAMEFYERNEGDMIKLRLSYDWAWLREYFEQKHGSKLNLI